MENFICNRKEWILKENESYWIIKENGEIANYFWANTKEDIKLFEYGNIFKSQRQAEKAREGIKLVFLKYNKSTYY